MIKIEPNLKLSTNNVASPTDENKGVKEEDVDMSKMSELGRFLFNFNDLIFMRFRQTQPQTQTK